MYITPVKRRSFLKYVVWTKSILYSAFLTHLPPFPYPLSCTWRTKKFSSYISFFLFHLSTSFLTTMITLFSSPSFSPTFSPVVNLFFPPQTKLYSSPLPSVSSRCASVTSPLLFSRVGFVRSVYSGFRHVVSSRYLLKSSFSTSSKYSKLNIDLFLNRDESLYDQSIIKRFNPYNIPF